MQYKSKKDLPPKPRHPSKTMHINYKKSIPFAYLDNSLDNNGERYPTINHDLIKSEKIKKSSNTLSSETDFFNHTVDLSKVNNSKFVTFAPEKINIHHKSPDKKDCSLDLFSSNKNTCLSTDCTVKTHKISNIFVSPIKQLITDDQIDDEIYDDEIYEDENYILEEKTDNKNKLTLDDLYSAKRSYGIHEIKSPIAVDELINSNKKNKDKAHNNTENSLKKSNTFDSFKHRLSEFEENNFYLPSRTRAEYKDNLKEMNRKCIEKMYGNKSAFSCKINSASLIFKERMMQRYSARIDNLSATNRSDIERLTNMKKQLYSTAVILEEHYKRQGSVYKSAIAREKNVNSGCLNSTNLLL